MLKKGVSVLGLIVILTVFKGFCAAMASYPQIIRTSSKDMTGGEITCSEFEDVNGKTYTGWILPIRLGGKEK